MTDALTKKQIEWVISRPTLAVGQADDLKYDDGEIRLWVARVGPEDGYNGPLVTAEKLSGGRWVPMLDVELAVRFAMRRAR